MSLEKLISLNEQERARVAESWHRSDPKLQLAIFELSYKFTESTSESLSAVGQLALLMIGELVENEKRDKAASIK